MQSNSATLLWANIADIYRRNFADTIHRQHRHISRYISVCRYIGQALILSFSWTVIMVWICYSKSSFWWVNTAVQLQCVTKRVWIVLINIVNRYNHVFQINLTEVKLVVWSQTVSHLFPKFAFAKWFKLFKPMLSLKWLTSQVHTHVLD